MHLFSAAEALLLLNLAGRLRFQRSEPALVPDRNPALE